MLCISCREQFDPSATPGGILLAPQGPVDEEGGAPTVKYHICPECYPSAKSAVTKVKDLICWECKSCGHEHWQQRGKSVPRNCPGCKNKYTTWIGHKLGLRSSCDPIEKVWEKEVVCKQPAFVDVDDLPDCEPGRHQPWCRHAKPK